MDSNSTLTIGIKETMGDRRMIKFEQSVEHFDVFESEIASRDFREKLIYVKFFKFFSALI